MFVVGLMIWILAPDIFRSLESTSDGESEAELVGNFRDRDVAPILIGTDVEGALEPKEPTLRDDDPHAFSLRGVVLADVSGDPIAEARVYLICADERLVPEKHTVASDTSGSFFLTGSTGCRQATNGLLVARADGYVPAQLDFLPHLASYTFRLRRGAAIVGVVQTPWGAPIEGADVIARLPWNRSGWPSTDRETIGDVSPGGRTTTNAQGAFVISGLTEGSAYDLIASRKGFGQRGMGYERKSAPSVRVVLELRPEARIRFVDERGTGSSMRDSSVVWMPSIMISGSPLLNSVGSTYWRTGHLGEERFLLMRETEHGRDISVEYALIVPGRRMLPGTAIARVGETTVERVSDGSKKRDLAPVTLVARFPGGLPFTGKLLLRVAGMGEGTQGGVVRVHFESGRCRQPLRLQPGSYQLSGMPGGDVTTAFWSGIPASSFTVGATGTSHTLVVQGRHYRLVVRDASGRRVHDYHIQVKGEGGRLSGWIESPGKFADEESVWLDPGRHTVTITTPELGLGAMEIVCVTDPEAGSISITLDPARTLDLWAVSKRVHSRR